MFPLQGRHAMHWARQTKTRHRQLAKNIANSTKVLSGSV